MGQGERPPDGDRAPAGAGGGGTLPGVGHAAADGAHVALAETVAPAAPNPATAATLAPAAPAAATANVATMATLAGTAAPPARDVAQAETMAAPPGHAAAAARANAASAETLPADGAAADDAGGADDGRAAHAATLQGPYTVADLPTLPRVDDATYAIGTEIARGGMGKILAARDRRLRREVVIKVMRRESGRIDPRFEREALITARLQHPSIVRVYDAGVLGDGRAFYAMERVRGRSLEIVLEGATSLRDRLALLPHAIAVCDALAYAHNEGVVHRDLKPSNVLLGPFGETVVIDWGLAKDLQVEDPDAPGTSGQHPRATTADSSLTQHGAVMGTPAFMAPEQARGEAADERTDIFALGALLYTMFTGSPPHTGASSDEVIDAVVSGRRVPIGKAEPALPPELVTIVERAMEHEPAARYASAKAMADDLRAYAAGKLVASHDYSTWALVRRWIARHRVPVGIAGLAVVLLALTGVLAFRRVLRERNAAQLAQQAEAVAREQAETAKDRFVLEQATAAFAADPSRAAGWMKQLSDEGLGWPETAALADQIAQAGLAIELAGHDQDVELVDGAPTGEHAATASDDSTVRWWNLATRGSVELPGHTGPIDSIAISSDGRYLATAGTDHQVLLWTLATTSSRTLLGHGNTVRGVAFSPDNTRLASTSEDGTLYVWDVASATGSELLRYTHSLRPVAWLDGTTLLVGAFDGALGRVDVTTRKVTWMRGHHKAELRCIALAPDRSRWIIGDEDGRVTLWSGTGKKLRELAPHNDVVRNAIITADGTHAVTAGGDADVHVYTLPEGSYHPLTGNTAGIKDIDVRGDLVVSAGIDSVVRVWKLDGTLVRSFRGHRSAVKGVAFAGDRVLSGAEDKMVRLWPLTAPPPPPKGAALRGWLAAQTNVEIGYSAMSSTPAPSVDVTPP